MLIKWDILTNHIIDHPLHFTDLFIGHLLEVREVKAQGVGRHERTLLLHMVTKYLFQCVVKQVSCRMVSGRSVALVGIHTSHKLNCGIFRQLLYDMNRLVILSFRIDDINSLCFIADDTAITNLSTHLSIKWRVVEYKLIELILLLPHFAITQDMTFIFGIVVAHELLFTLGKFHPVRVLNSCSIAGTFLLFLHLYVELLFVDGKAVLTANQFCKVKGEAVSIEETESLLSIKFRLSFDLELLHSLIKKRDTLVEGTEEGILFLLHHLGNELLLSFQLGEGITHLSHQSRQEFIKEALFLAEERISVTYRTTQDTTDHIACLSIRGQLTIGNRERDSTEMISTYSHSHVDIVLFLRDGVQDLFFKGGIFQTRYLLLGLDYGLEHIGIVVRVLTLHHADKTFKTHTCIDDIHTQLLQ